MSKKVNWHTWVKLLTEDLDWLKAQPRTLERDHVIAVLDDLINTPDGSAYYYAQPNPRP